MSEEEGSGSSNFGDLDYRVLTEGATLIHSRQSSPETQEAAREMEEYQERVKSLKQTRKAVKTKLTTVKKALLNTLRNKDALESRVNAGKKIFHNVFEALNDAHSNYIATKEEEDMDPQDDDYMNIPLQHCIEIEKKLAVWHMARQVVMDNATHTERERQQQVERDHRIQDEDRVRTKDLADAVDRAIKAKEDKIKSLIACLECEVESL